MSDGRTNITTGSITWDASAPLVVDMFSHTKSNPPCKHFLTGIFNDTAKKCPYCEIDSLRNTMQALSEANEAWSTKLKDASVAAIAEAAEVDRLTAELATLKELLSESLYALEYGLDMTKPDDMSGCDCPMCVVSRKIRKLLGENQ